MEYSKEVTKQGIPIHTIDYGYSRVIISAITCNCQLTILGGIEDLLNNTTANEYREVFRLMSLYVCYNLYLIDINQLYLDDFKKKGGTMIMSEQFFTSTNDSERAIVIFQIV